MIEKGKCKYKNDIVKIFIFFIIFSNQLFSNTSNLIFEKISINQGLTQNFITCIYLDSRGFIWFGTSNGLNKYDGLKFIKYFYNASKKLSISSNYIISISEDSNRNIWVNTTGGLNKFLVDQEVFKKYKIDGDNKYLPALYQDIKKELWIGKGNKLYKYNVYLDKIECHMNIFNKDKIIDAITSIIKSKDNHLFIGTYNSGLYIFKNKKLTKHYTNSSLSSNSISTLLIDKEKNIWVGTYSSGLNKIDHFDNRIKHFIFQNHKNSINNNIIRSIIEYGDEIWVGTINGLSIYKKKHNLWNNYKNISDDQKSISQNDIRSLLVDRSKNIWIGTFGGGINKTNPKKTMFEHIRSGKNPTKNINNNLVWSIFEDSFGDFWVGTEEGINRYIKTEKKYRYYNKISINTLTNTPLFPMSITEDRNNVWIGTNSGLLKYLREDDKFIKYKSRKTDINSVSYNNISTLFVDSKMQLWVGTTRGLNKYNADKDNFTRYGQYDSLRGRIFEVNEDHKKNLWVATVGKLIKFKDNTISATIILKPKAEANNGYNYTRFIYFPDSEIMWAGTKGGILEFSLKNNRLLKRYSRKNGLPSNDVRGIAEDKFHNIWISTNNGISQYNIKLDTFNNFTVHDGIENSEFNQSSFFKNKAGKIFFGGNNGITAFYPKKTVLNKIKPDIYITKFKLFNKEVKIGKNSVLKRPIISSDKIILENDQNFFSFEFSVLDFTAPFKNKYKYKLDGIDRDWISTNSENRTANYTNIPPGDYVFKVIGSNNDGYWNEEGRRIKIIVIPPWWKTIWFKILFYSMIIISFSFLYRRHIKKIKQGMKKKEALERLYAEHKISKREIEVIDLVLKKKKNKEIEDILFISYHTVKNHIRNIYAKLNVTNRGDLMILIKSVQSDVVSKSDFFDNKEKKS